MELSLNQKDQDTKHYWRSFHWQRSCRDFQARFGGSWGKAGQRSLERSALVEAIEQLTRALTLN